MGVAIAEGHFTSVAEKANIVLDEFVGTDKEAISREQILHMRAGLAANRNIFDSGDQTAHVLANTLTRSPRTAFDHSKQTLSFSSFYFVAPLAEMRTVIYRKRSRSQLVLTQSM